MLSFNINDRNTPAVGNFIKLCDLIASMYSLENQIQEFDAVHKIFRSQSFFNKEYSNNSYLLARYMRSLIRLSYSLFKNTTYTQPHFDLQTDYLLYVMKSITNDINQLNVLKNKNIVSAVMMDIQELIEDIETEANIVANFNSYYAHFLTEVKGSAKIFIDHCKQEKMHHA